MQKKCLRACADKEGPDQPAHPRSLYDARMVSKGPDDTLHILLIFIGIFSLETVELKTRK